VENENLAVSLEIGGKKRREGKRDKARQVTRTLRRSSGKKKWRSLESTPKRVAEKTRSLLRRARNQKDFTLGNGGRGLHKPIRANKGLAINKGFKGSLKNNRNLDGENVATTSFAAGRRRNITTPG